MAKEAADDVSGDAAKFRGGDNCLFLLGLAGSEKLKARGEGSEQGAEKLIDGDDVVVVAGVPRDDPAHAPFVVDVNALRRTGD